MFKLITLAALISVSSAFAKEYQHPTDSEIQQKRACFQDVEVQGCTKQEEDPVQFQECLSNIVDKLDDSCKDLMLDLYGDK